MTTYTLNGIANYYDNNLANDVGAEFSGITLELVVPDKTKDFSYTVLPLAPGDSAPDDLYVETDLNDSTVRLNGETITNNNGFDESIFEVTWIDVGRFERTSFIFIAEVLDVTVPGFGVVDANYIFSIGGASLPTFTHFAQWVNFLDKQLVGLEIPGGTYAPGVDIQLSMLGATVTQDDIITGTGAANTINGGIGDDTISGLKGGDKLNGNKGSDTLNGGNGADMLHGNTQRDTLNGGGGNDKLFGDDGNDKLYGGKGSDILNGGAGNDVMTGGRGTDIFVFKNNAGKDKIKDFDATNNMEDINLKAVTKITGFNDLKNNHMSQAGNDVVIDDNNGTMITLQNVDLSDLGKGDFIF